MPQLHLFRRSGESIEIFDSAGNRLAKIELAHVKGDGGRLTVWADRDIKILRSELVRREAMEAVA